MWPMQLIENVSCVPLKYYYFCSISTKCYTSTFDTINKEDVSSFMCKLSRNYPISTWELYNLNSIFTGFCILAPTYNTTEVSPRCNFLTV